MNTIDEKNSNKTNIDSGNQNITDKNVYMNEELYDNDELKDIDLSNRDIAEQGYTVRNGYDPNKPNPEQEITNDEDDLDDLNDDFHIDRDLEPDDLDPEIDIDGDERVVNDEFDNPSDDFGETFNETEEDLEDIDQDEDEDIEEEDDLEYKEDDIQEEETVEDYPANDPRKF